MEPLTYIYIVITAIIVFGLSIAYLIIRRNLAEQKIKVAEQTARRIEDESKKEAETRRKEIILEAKDEAIKLKAETERQIKERNKELLAMEKRILQKEEHLDKKEELFTKQEEGLKQKEEELQQIKTALEGARQEQIKELQRISGISKEEAKNLLLKQLEKELDKEAAVRIKAMEDNIKKEADKKAKEIIVTAIQRCAVDHTVESVVSVAELPSDEMKGRIIGREGRNIRAFETVSGVDLVVDDTPEAVIISSFDPLRRETARLALSKLIADGRIHPARVEEMYEKSRQEVKATMWEAGEKAALELGITNLPPVLIQLIGRLKYRTSYGQNCLQHTIEVAHLAGMLAAELDVNIKLAKRGGLLHDIGKAIDQETEGTHTKLGAMFAQKAGESADVIHCIMAHHEDEPPRTIEAVLVLVADAISASRPGARRDTLEAYIKRLQKLEAVAYSFEGVEKAFAIQAGREIRIIVKPDKIDDLMSTKLAHDVAKKIEAELDYPGEVRVTVIRETRAMDVAK